MEKQIVKVYKKNEYAKLPEMKTDGAFAFDLYANESYLIGPHSRGTVGTGLIIEVPEGFALRIVPRSGLASGGILISNSPGTIDDDYRGELKVLLYNITEYNRTIEAGNRIAQCYLERKIPTRFVEVESITDLSTTERGEGGFGSTGV